MTTQNYPRMQNAWRQRERRDGIVLKRVKLEIPVASTKSFVDQIAAAIRRSSAPGCSTSTTS